MTDAHLIVVPHTHWDREWYRTHEAFRFRLVRLLDDLLDLLEGDPDFRHFTLDGQTIVLEDYLAVRPRARERIAKLVRAGRLVIGPWYVLPDEWLVSGEALIRNLRMGLVTAAEFGGAMPVGYVPDQFGHVGQLPQLFAGFGFDAAALWRGVGGDVDDVAFLWEAPDGTRAFTLYLERGYGNAVHLPLDPAALAERIRHDVDTQRQRSEFRSVLWMNGSDHQEPQPGLPAALAAAAALADVSCELGTLPDFLARARAEAPASLTVHRGELRSGLRSPLLEGCASARMPQKRRDFLNDRLLTRQLEPLAAWLGALGGAVDRDRIDFAWRVALENHPHDSICGCSIDAVHDEMDVRSARTAEIAGNHLRQVTRELARHIALPPGIRRPAVAVWNPNAGGRSQAEGVLEFDVRPAARRAPALHLRDAAGRRIPVHSELLEAGQCFAEYAVPAHVAERMLSGFPNEFFGLAVCGLVRARSAGRLVVDVLMGEEPPLAFDLAAEKKHAATELAVLGGAEVLYRVRRLARLRLRFVDDFPGCGLRIYGVARGRAGSGRAASAWRTARSADGGASIQNEYWRIEAAPDGRVAWIDRKSGTRTEDALRLVSEADRGDAYNFDPVPGAPIISRPDRARVTLTRGSDAQVGIALELGYRLPEGLRADRAGRSARSVAVPARVELWLACGLDRIDVRVELNNRARDHRFRAHVRSGLAGVRFEVESAFEVAERPITPAPDAFGSASPAEFPIGATPQRCFAGISDGTRSVSVANRGCAEVEAVRESDGRIALALSLLRAVGQLSRGDLKLRPGHAGPPLATPGAQVPGAHTVEFALRAHATGDPGRTAAAHHYAFPPLAFGVGASMQGRLADAARLLAVDDPFVVVSAIEPQREGPPVFRLYNASDTARRLRLSHGVPGAPGLERVDLMGRPQREGAGVAASAGDGAELVLGPWQIVSLRPR
jgi:hypothetical protein